MSSSWLRGHSNNTWHFLDIFGPTTPLCHLVTLPPPRPPVCDVKLEFFKKIYFLKQFVRSKTSKCILFFSKKCHVTLWLTSSLPLLIFGDTVPILSILLFTLLPSYFRGPILSLTSCSSPCCPPSKFWLNIIVLFQLKEQKSWLVLFYLKVPDLLHCSKLRRTESCSINRFELTGN